MSNLPGLGACALAAAFAVSVHATDVALPTNGTAAGYGEWNPFNVSDIDSRTFGLEWIDNANTNSPGFGSPLNFVFSIASGYVGTLTVVDAGFAGDTFEVTNLGRLLGTTSAVQNTQLFDLGYDFDAALADANFSRGVFDLASGSHSISGLLVQSYLLDGEALNSTVGAVRLTVSPVPEATTGALLLAGLGLLGALARRGRRVVRRGR